VVLPLLVLLVVTLLPEDLQALPLLVVLVVTLLEDLQAQLQAVQMQAMLHLVVLPLPRIPT
jgi:hypothetical protein